jgi:hypothetical protein
MTNRDGRKADPNLHIIAAMSNTCLLWPLMSQGIEIPGAAKTSFFIGLQKIISIFHALCIPKTM